MIVPMMIYAMIVILFLVILFAHDNINLNKFSKELKIGDEFEGSVSSDNPFERDIIFTIQIKDIKEGWIEYDKVCRDGSSSTLYCTIEDFFYKYKYNK